ncbi:MAG: glycosyltransferase family 87 protein [Bacteroidia bacterium]
MKTKKDFLFVLVFLGTCFVLIYVSKDQPIGDFGNYYYGSRIFSDNGNAALLYNDIHVFNEHIKGYGEENFFENYSPVPPFAIPFYYPFIFLKAGIAKLLFNILAALFLCFSILAFLKQENKMDYKYWLFLPVLIMPLYYNFVQGQSYTLITGLLLLIYLCYKKKQYLLAGCCIALLFHLKIFPGFILFYFIIRGEYKIVLGSILAISVLLFCTVFIAGSDLVWNYYTEIVPRLLKNEIVEPFYYGHQSIHIFFQNLFTYDQLANPLPLIDLPELANICEGILVATFLYFIYAIVKKNDDSKTFSLFIFFILVINKYLPSYTLLMLLPFIITSINNRGSLIRLLLLTVACNLPLAWLPDMPWLIKYSRVILTLLVFIMAMAEYKPAVNSLKLVSAMALLVFFMMMSWKRTDNFYLSGINSKGVYYNLNVHDQSIILYRCMGKKDYTDTLKPPLFIKTISELDSHPLLTGNNNKKIYVINSNTLVYLSDFQQGVGIFRPRLQKLR